MALPLSHVCAHRTQQRQLRMANAPAYQNFDLVFAKEPADLQTPTAALGHPCQSLAGGQFQRVIRAAGVKAIKFHGLRHKAATLIWRTACRCTWSLSGLGHAQTSMALKVYAHALSGMRKGAADRLGELLAIGANILQTDPTQHDSTRRAPAARGL